MKTQTIQPNETVRHPLGNGAYVESCGGDLPCPELGKERRVSKKKLLAYLDKFLRRQRREELARIAEGLGCPVDEWSDGMTVLKPPSRG